MDLRVRRLNTASSAFDSELAALLQFSAETDAAVEQAVIAIIAGVRARGDAAVLEYTARFDGVSATSLAELEVPAADLLAAFNGLPPAQRAALQAPGHCVRRAAWARP